MVNNLGHNIRLAREAAGFTQEALAELIGVSRTAIVRWENGDTEPKLNHLIHLTKLLNVSSDMLLGISGKNISLCNLSPDAVLALERFITEIRKLE